MRSAQLVVLLLSLVCLSARPADAAPVTLSGTATLSTIVDPNNMLAGFGFTAGQTITFQTEFDPTGLIDQFSETTFQGSYSSSTKFGAGLNGYTFQFTSTQLIITDHFTGDGWELNGFGSPSSSATGLALSELGLLLADPAGSVFSSDALVFPPPPLSAFSIETFSIGFRNRTTGQTARLTGTVDSVNSVNPVPEPATLSLLGLGLAGVVARRRMKRH